MNAALLSLVRLVLGHARLKRLARRVLQLAPGLQARLQLWMHQTALPPRKSTPQTGSTQLSQRARQLHCQLRRVRGI